MGSGSSTMVAPASHVAWISVTRGRVVGPSTATWSPGTTPRACRAAAMARASSWTSAHGTVTSASPLMNVTVAPR